MMKAKETPRVRDTLVIEGGARGERRGGLRSEDGTPLDPAVIARNYDVTLERAKEIIRSFSL